MLSAHIHRTFVCCKAEFWQLLGGSYDFSMGAPVKIPKYDAGKSKKKKSKPSHKTKCL
jgi:hypothetical protein